MDLYLPLFLSIFCSTSLYLCWTSHQFGWSISPCVLLKKKKANLPNLGWCLISNIWICWSKNARNTSPVFLGQSSTPGGSLRFHCHPDLSQPHWWQRCSCTHWLRPVTAAWCPIAAKPWPSRQLFRWQWWRPGWATEYLVNWGIKNQGTTKKKTIEKTRSNKLRYSGTHWLPPWHLPYIPAPVPPGQDVVSCPRRSGSQWHSVDGWTNLKGME